MTKQAVNMETCSFNINSSGACSGRFFAWQKKRDSNRKKPHPKKASPMPHIWKHTSPLKIDMENQPNSQGRSSELNLHFRVPSEFLGMYRWWTKILQQLIGYMYLYVFFYFFYGKSRYLNISVSWISWDMIMSNIPESLISLIHPRYRISATTVRHFVDRSPVWWAWGWLKAVGRCHLFWVTFLRVLGRERFGAGGSIKINGEATPWI